ncbi:hypothetical protein FQA39_LY07720 [Lamprigera yunnana]|nr:hypothetical protein FQA39_LY07720 [Lamprigera yunnana]
MAQEYTEFKDFQYNSLGKKIIDEDGKLQCIFKDAYGNEQLISVDKQQLIAANMLEEETHVDHPQPSTTAASNASCNLGSEFT